MKQKQTLLKVLLLAPVLAGLLSLATSANAAAIPAWLTVTGFIGEAFGRIIGTVLAGITYVIVSIIFPFCYLIINSLITNSDMFLSGNDYAGNVNPAEITQQIWSFSLGLANGIFLLALIVVSVAIILRIDTKIYNIKKILGGLIAAIILSNISLLIVQTALVIGDQLTIAATSLLGSTPEAPSDLLQGIYESVSGADVILTGSVPAKAVFIVASILLLGIMFKLIFILFQRMIWIFFLLISAPVAFALSILPATQEYAKKWWEALLKWVLVLPLVLLALTISKKIIDAAGGVGPLLSWSPPSDTSAGTLDPRLLITIAGLALMYFAGQVDKIIKLGGISASSVSKGIGDTISGKNAVGKAGGFIKDTGYKAAMSTEWGKKLEGQRLSKKGLLGRVVNPKGEKARVDSDRTRMLRESQTDALLSRASANKKTLDGIKDVDDDGNPLSEAQEKANEKRKEALKKSIGEDLGAVNYFVGKAARETPTDDSVDVLSSKLNKDYEGRNDKPINRGAMAEKIYHLRAASRNTRVPQAERDKAKTWLKSNQNVIEHVGLKYDSYRPVEKDVLPSTYGDVQTGTYDIKEKKNKAAMKQVQEKITIDSGISNANLQNIVADDKTLKATTQDQTKLDALSTEELENIQNTLNESNADYKTEHPDEKKSLLQKIQESREKGETGTKLITTIKGLGISDPKTQKLLFRLANEDLTESSIAGRIAMITKAAKNDGVDITQVIEKVKGNLKKAHTLQNKGNHIKLAIKQQTEEKRQNYTTTIEAVIEKRAATRKGTSDKKVIKQEIHSKAQEHYDNISKAVEQQADISSDTKLSDISGTNIAKKANQFLRDHGTDFQNVKNMTVGEALEQTRLIENVTKKQE